VIGIVALANPLHKLRDLVLASGVGHPRGDQVRDVNVDKPALDFAARNKRDTIMRLVVEIGRFNG